MDTRLKSAIDALELLLVDVHYGNFEMIEVKIGQIRNQLTILGDDLREPRELCEVWYYNGVQIINTP
jgi:hypothetical protein